MLVLATQRDSLKAMRYVLQFVIPACVFLVLIYLVARKKRTPSDAERPIVNSTTFILCLVIASGLTVGLLYGISAL